MKKTLFRMSLMLLLIISTNGISQTAIEYMNKISKEFDKISEETWDYARAVAHKKKGREIESQRKQMIAANRNALKRVKNMPGFNGSNSYRDSTASYLELSYLVLNNDYAKIVDMEEVAEQSYDAMEAYMLAQQIANDKLDAAYQVFNTAHEKFAAENNINLIKKDDETSQKLEKAGEVFRYYNQIYLIFFKPYKQEVYLIAALNRGDINAMKQNQEALSNLSAEAKLKLNEIKPYKGNNSLKMACNQVLDFYIYEADKKASSLVDFYLKKEKFEKLKAATDKKGKNLTSDEAKEFNAAVAEYNKASDEFNKINEDLNKRRSAALDNWNNSVSKFLDKNISKKK
jgi:hypothetical protein